MFEGMPSPARKNKAEEAPPKRESVRTPLERTTYALENGASVELLSREFDVHSPNEGRPSRDVVFLPGWSMAADSAALDELGRAYAEKGNGRTLAVSSRAEGDGEDTLYDESKAIATYIRDKGLRDVVLVGHSQGGDKAVDVASLLQGEEGVTVRGLVLLDAVGLYDQSEEALVSGFAKDALKLTPQSMMGKIGKDPGTVLQGVRASGSIIAGIFRGIERSGTSYLSRTRSEVAEMARKNPRLAEIEVPVILMSGTKDPISHPGQILPEEKEAAAVEAWKNDESHAPGEFVDSREALLHETTFPKSPYIRMVTPEKLGHHGLPFFRSESVANTSLYLLERYERRPRKESHATLEP